MGRGLGRGDSLRRFSEMHGHVRSPHSTRGAYSKWSIGLRRRDGEYRWILDRGTPRYTPDGTFAGYIGSCVDITDRKRMEADLRKAVRDRDDFLSIASHELRTPLTTLSLEIQSLRRALDQRPK